MVALALPYRSQLIACDSHNVSFSKRHSMRTLPSTLANITNSPAGASEMGLMLSISLTQHPPVRLESGAYAIGHQCDEIAVIPGGMQRIQRLVVGQTLHHGNHARRKAAFHQLQSHQQARGAAIAIH